MTFKELKAEAKKQGATYVIQLHRAWQKELLAMGEYIAERNEYEFSYDELHDDLLTSKIDDLSDFFEAFEQTIEGDVFGVCYKTDGMKGTDTLTDNGKGMTWEEAYSTALQIKIQGHWAIIYPLADYEITA